MPPDLISRRALSFGLAALYSGLACPTRASTASLVTVKESSSDGAGLTRIAEAIHQELTLQADRRQVYDVLTDAGKFDAVTRLSDAVALVTAPNAQPTSISPEVGGPFTLFGGYITGRHLDMVRDERLVQAWRVGSWDPGDYSLVRFVLQPAGTGTRVVFDHRGFPQGKGEHLASGWHTHYWEPLAKYLARN